MIQDECGINKKLITTRNPQANSIVERAHKTAHNMIRTTGIRDKDDVEARFGFTGILSAVRRAVNSTVHTTMRARCPPQCLSPSRLGNHPSAKATNDQSQQREREHLSQRIHLRCWSTGNGKDGPQSKTWRRFLQGAIHG